MCAFAFFVVELNVAAFSDDSRFLKDAAVEFVGVVKGEPFFMQLLNLLHVFLLEISYNNVLIYYFFDRHFLYRFFNKCPDYRMAL